MKLYFALYFEITDEKLVKCIGTTRDGSLSEQDSKEAWQRISSFWQAVRSENFGRALFLSQLIEHLATMHDFKAYVFNLEREERLSEIAPTSETPAQRTTRLAKASRFGGAKGSHVARLTPSLAGAVDKARAELERLEDEASTAGLGRDTTAIRGARYVLEF